MVSVVVYGMDVQKVSGGSWSFWKGLDQAALNTILAAMKGNWLATWLRLQVRLARVREDLV